MKKSLLVLICPVLFASIPIDSTEIPFQLSNQEHYQLTTQAFTNDVRQIPSNPNVYHEVLTYLDKDLTEVDSTLQPNQPFTIIGVDVNKKNQLIFQLSDNSYIQADATIIYDDVILAQENITGTYWLKKDFHFYSNPIVNQSKRITTTKEAYSAVEVTEIVDTHRGKFAKVKGVGWIDTNYLSETDNRIEAVQEILTNRYQNENLSVFVKQLSTQNTAGIHQDKMMYAASVTKLATLYYVQYQLDQGKYHLSQGLQYTKPTEEFKGAYNPTGSGSIVKSPDNHHYRIDDLINRVAKESDNVASNILAYYMTNQFDDDFTKIITDITGQTWDMDNRQANAEMAGLLMEQIYYQGGYVLGSLQSTNFDGQRISRDIHDTVAHKIGDAYDFKHDVAVVYTDTPFVLSIFTENSSYDTISQIANDVYGILK